MKRYLLSLILIIASLKLTAQEVFTDVFQGSVPFSLATVDNYLYVGIFYGSNTIERGIYRVNYDDPTDIVLVWETPIQHSSGPLEIAYDEDTNDLYVNSGSSRIMKVDLDLALPITAENLITFDNTFAGNNGLVYHNNYVYFVQEQGIFRKSTVNDSDPELFMSTTNGSNYILAGERNGLLYFYIKNADSTEIALYSSDISNTDDEPVLISNMDGFYGFPQGAHLKGNTLYTTLEGSGGFYPLIKFNLSQSGLIEPEMVLDSSEGGIKLGITSFETSLYFINHSTQRIQFIEEASLQTSEFDSDPQITIYPNPVSDKLFIQSDSSLQYKLVNTLGEVIAEGISTQEAIDLSNFSDGFYFLETQSTTVSSKKIYKIIKH